MFLNKADEEDVKAIVRLLSAKAEEHKEDGFRAFVYFLDGTPNKLKKLNAELKADNKRFKGRQRMRKYAAQKRKLKRMTANAIQEADLKVE